MSERTIRFPRPITHDETVAISSALSDLRPLWASSDVRVPVVPLTDRVAACLRAAARDGQLLRGIDPALRTLTNEDRSRATLTARGVEASPHPPVSRWLVFSTDGTERFYRQIESALTRFAPRVAGCFVACDAQHLGNAVFGGDATAKLVLLSHKDAVTAFLRALTA